MKGCSPAFLFIVWLTMLVADLSLAQDQTSSDGSPIVVVAQDSRSDSSQPLNAIAMQSVLQELARRGFSPTLVTAPAPVDADSFAKAVAQSAAPESRYAVSLGSQLAGTRITVRLAWFDAKKSAIEGRVEQEGPADLTLDRVVFSALGRLIAKVGPLEMVRSPSPAATPAETAPPPAETPPVVPPKSAESPAVVNPETSPASHPASQQPPVQPPVLSPQRPSETDARRGLELGIAAAPFVVAGDLSLFFRLSGNLQTRLSYRVPAGSLDVAFGIMTAPVIFRVVGPLDSGSGLLVPVAGELRLSAPFAANTFVPYLRAVGGAALLYVSTGTGGSRTAFLPYFGGGIGLTRTFGSKAGLSLDLLTSIFADGTDFIIGLNPGLELTFLLGAHR